MKKMSLFLVFLLMLPNLSFSISREVIIVGGSTLAGAGAGAGYYFSKHSSDQPIVKHTLIGAILLGGGLGFLGGGLLVHIIKALSSKKEIIYETDVKALQERVEKELREETQKIVTEYKTKKQVLEETHNKELAELQRKLQLAAIELRKDTADRKAAQEAYKKEMGLLDQKINDNSANHYAALRKLNEDADKIREAQNKAFEEKMQILQNATVPNADEIKAKWAEIDKKYGLK